jgi:hypothetical protein
MEFLADELLERARKFRQQAESMHDPEIRQLLLMLADDYDALARERSTGDGPSLPIAN